MPTAVMAIPVTNLPISVFLPSLDGGNDHADGGFLQSVDVFTLSFFLCSFSALWSFLTDAASVASPRSAGISVLAGFLVKTVSELHLRLPRPDWMSHWPSVDLQCGELN